MPITRYKIWGWGNKRATAITEQYTVGIAALAKRSQDSNFEVANEMICMHLGVMIGLPIPLGITLERNNQIYFGSLDFNVEGEKLPPADTELVAREQASLACGIVVFDSWVANSDRHDENIAYNTETKNLYIFDHGRALLSDVGLQYLEDNKDKLAINSGNHCLVGDIASPGEFGEWLDRINQLPEFVIKNTVNSARDLGLSRLEAEACIDFLVTRKQSLKSIFRNNIHEFPKLPSMIEGVDPFL